MGRKPGSERHCINIEAAKMTKQDTGTRGDRLPDETADITGRRRMEEEKAAMLGQITFLNRAAGDLLSGTDADLALNTGLWDILRYFDGRRAYIFEFDTDRETAANTYEVCAPGTVPAKDILQEVPFSSFAAWFGLFERDGCIAISDVSALGDDRAAERELLRVQQISSLIVVPMRENGRLTGMMGVDDPARNVDQLPGLQAIGDYISVMLVRRRMTQELRDSNLRLQAMMSDTPGGFVQMVIHEDGTITPDYINDGFCGMLGMTQKEAHAVFDADAYAGAHPDDCERVSALLSETIAKRSAATTRVRLRTGGKGYITVEAHYRVWEKPDGRLFLNGYYRDISDRLAKEEEYRRNMAYREVNDRRAIGSYHLNVTRNTVDGGASPDPAIRALGKRGTLDGFIEGCASIQRENEHKRFCELFSRGALLRAMEEGRTQISMEHTLFPAPDKTLWISSTADLFKNPETGDVEGFIYARDLTEEHMLHQMMSTVVNIGYDFIVAIGVKTKIYRTFKANTGVSTAFRETGIYDDENTVRELLSIIHPDDRGAAFAAMRLDSLAHELENRSWA